MIAQGPGLSLVCLPRPEGSRNTAPSVSTASKASFHRCWNGAVHAPAYTPRCGQRLILQSCVWSTETAGRTSAQVKQPPFVRQELPLSSFYKRGYRGSWRFCEGGKERAGSGLTPPRARQEGRRGGRGEARHREPGAGAGIMGAAGSSH